MTISHYSYTEPCPGGTANLFLLHPSCTKGHLTCNIIRGRISSGELGQIRDVLFMDNTNYLYVGRKGLGCLVAVGKNMCWQLGFIIAIRKDHFKIAICTDVSCFFDRDIGGKSVMTFFKEVKSIKKK